MKFTQVLLFSASVDKKTRTNTLCFKPIFIDINSNSGNTSQIPSTIKHISVISDRRERIETLRKIIKAVKPEKAIIFVNSKYDLEESLRVLGTDYIDIYFYHRDNEAIPAGELIEIMEEFRKEGKIRYYACSNWSTARMKEADAYAASKGYRGFVANEALFNIGSASMRPLADDTLAVMDQEMQKYHAENPQNLAMPYMSVCSGFFHKLYAGGADAVRNSEYYTPENLKAAEGLHGLMEEYQISLTALWTEKCRGPQGSNGNLLYSIP